jgi:hypothetical protein
MDTGSFTGVKRPGRGLNHRRLSGIEVKGKVELYVFCLYGMFWVNFTFTFYRYIL